MVIVYLKLTDADAFYRQQPGKEPHFCFEEKFKGDNEAILHWIAYMLEANRLLYPAQKDTSDYVLFLNKGQLTKYAGQNVIWPVRSIQVTNSIPMLAEVCRN